MRNVNFIGEVKKRLAGASRIAVVGIGDECSAIDRLGMYAARQLRNCQVPQISVFLAGTVPESVTASIRRYRPDHILLLDAADMGARPGTIAVISQETIRGTLLSTHVMPLSVVMEYMAWDSSAKVTLLGIQPDLDRPESGLSDEAYGVLSQNLHRLSTILARSRSPAKKTRERPQSKD